MLTVRITLPPIPPPLQLASEFEHNGASARASILASELVRLIYHARWRATEGYRSFHSELFASKYYLGMFLAVAPPLSPLPPPWSSRLLMLTPDHAFADKVLELAPDTLGQLADLLPVTDVASALVYVHAGVAELLASCLQTSGLCNARQLAAALLRLHKVGMAMSWGGGNRACARPVCMIGGLSYSAITHACTHPRAHSPNWWRTADCERERRL